MADASETILRSLGVLRLIRQDNPMYGTINNPGLVFDTSGNLQGVQDKAGNLQGFGAASVADATSSVKGKLQLAGALGGTATAPTAFGFADLTALSVALNAAYARLDNLKTVGGQSLAGTGDIPVGGGSSIPTQIAFDYELNLSGNFECPNTAYDGTPITVGATAPGSYLGFNLIGSGIPLVLSGIGMTGDPFNETPGAINNMTAGLIAGIPGLTNYDPGLFLPAILSAIISNGDAIHVVWTVNATVVTAPLASDITFSGGHTASAVSHTGVTFTATINAATAGEVITYSIPAGKITTAAGSNLAIVGASITNNVAFAARVDNCTRADNAGSPNSPSDGGSNYVTLRGATFGVSGNQLYCSSSSVDSIMAINTGNVDNQQFWKFIGGSDDYPEQLTRLTDNSNYIGLVYRLASGSADLYKNVGGVSTTIFGSVVVNGSSLIGVTFSGQFRVNGATLEYWIAIGAGAFTHIPALDYTITDPALMTGTFVAAQSSGNGNTTRITHLG